MKTPDLNLRLEGLVRPPENLESAARQELGDRYEEFVTRFPNYNHHDLVNFLEAA